MRSSSSWTLRITLLKNLSNCLLSAISGTACRDVLKVQALVKGKMMLILLDSGSSHFFVNPTFLHKVGIQSHCTPPRQVKVKNREIMITDQVVHNFQWQCQGHTMCADLQVLDLGACDAILGYDWSSQHSPMTSVTGPTFMWNSKTKRSKLNCRARNLFLYSYPQTDGSQR